MTNKKTPAQELGYKVGDVFTLKKGSEIGKDYSSNLMNAASSRIVLEEDDGSSCIKFYLEGHSEISGYVYLKAVKKTLPKGSFEEAVDHFIENTEGTEAFVSTELNKIVVYFDGMEFIGNKDRAIEVMKALLVLFPKQ